MEQIVKKYTQIPNDNVDVDLKNKMQQLQTNIDIIFQQIRAVEEKGNITFSNEKEAINLYKKQLSELDQKKYILQQREKISKKKFKKINIDFMTMTKKREITVERNEKNVVIPLKTPMFSFHQYYHSEEKETFKKCNFRLDLCGKLVTNIKFNFYMTESPLTTKVKETYKNANFIKRIIAPFNSETSIELEDNFLGLIPAEIKKECREAESMFDSIYLVKEANWQIKEVQKDPLIIGFIENEAYLISQFDCTPIEHYAKSEF